MDHFITEIVFMVLIITSVISFTAATWLIKGGAALDVED